MKSDDIKGYSPLRRWLREERVRDALLVKVFASVCDYCGRWLWREDDNGWTHGSAMHLADGRMVHWSCLARVEQKALDAHENPYFASTTNWYLSR